MWVAAFTSNRHSIRRRKDGETVCNIYFSRPRMWVHRRSFAHWCQSVPDRTRKGRSNDRALSNPNRGRRAGTRHLGHLAREYGDRCIGLLHILEHHGTRRQTTSPARATRGANNLPSVCGVTRLNSPRKASLCVTRLTQGCGIALLWFAHGRRCGCTANEPATYRCGIRYSEPGGEGLG